MGHNDTASKLPWALSRILAPKCQVCDQRHDQPNRLCRACITSISDAAFTCPIQPHAAGNLRDPHRNGLELPEYRPHDPAQAIALTTAIKGLRQLQSAFRYQEAIADLITRWKYQGMIELTPYIAALMGTQICELGDYDRVTCAPTHWRRRLTRGFDHIWLLSNALAHRGLIAPPTALLAHRKSLPFQHLRPRNDRAISADHFHTLTRLDGLQILIIDDVVTTGSTLAAAAGALIKAGAHSVDALTIASAQQGTTAGV